MSQPRYLQAGAVVDAIRGLRWGWTSPITNSGPTTSPSLTIALFDHAFILGPNQITDVYLLGLAVKNGGRLVTFDRGLPLKAVRGAEARHLVVL